jgi:hypothetical protein
LEKHSDYFQSSEHELSGNSSPFIYPFISQPAPFTTPTPSSHSPFIQTPKHKILTQPTSPIPIPHMHTTPSDEKTGPSHKTSYYIFSVLVPSLS